MKILTRHKFPNFYSLTEKCMEFTTRNHTTEIPDYLIAKMIAVIDEIFDRSNHFKKEDDGLIRFPLFPESFYQIDRIHKDGTKEIVNNGKWVDFWSDTIHKNIITERVQILNMLNDAETLWSEDLLENAYEYTENKYLALEINKDKLLLVRKRLLKYQEKTKNIDPYASIQSDKAVKSILIITPTYTNFEYFWIVFNHDYAKKHKVSMKNKFNNGSDSNGKNIWTLYNEKKVDSDSSLLNYMNSKIFEVKAFSNFEKTKLVKIVKGKILINDIIKLEKKSKEELDNEIIKYFS